VSGRRVGGVADLLAEAGEERRAALTAAREATDRITALLPEARAAGIPVSALMLYAGMSRQGVYDLLGRT